MHPEAASVISEMSNWEAILANLWIKQPESSIYGRWAAPLEERGRFGALLRGTSLVFCCEGRDSVAHSFQITRAAVGETGAAAPCSEPQSRACVLQQEQCRHTRSSSLGLSSHSLLQTTCWSQRNHAEGIQPSPSPTSPSSIHLPPEQLTCWCCSGRQDQLHFSNNGS